MNRKWLTTVDNGSPVETTLYEELPFDVLDSQCLSMPCYRIEDQMLPREFIQENLHRAHVKAIAAVAGMSFDEPRTDCGVDGTFKAFAKHDGRVLATGAGIDCQLKASFNWRTSKDDQTIVYDLKVKNYNDLVRRKCARKEQNACYPLILVLLALPREDNRWLQIENNRTILEHCCYWYGVDSDELSNNAETQAVYIPRTQLFTPSVLSELVLQVKNGEFQ